MCSCCWSALNQSTHNLRTFSAGYPAVPPEKVRPARCTTHCPVVPETARKYALDPYHQNGGSSCSHTVSRTHFRTSALCISSQHDEVPRVCGGAAGFADDCQPARRVPGHVGDRKADKKPADSNTSHEGDPGAIPRPDRRALSQMPKLLIRAAVYMNRFEIANSGQ